MGERSEEAVAALSLGPWPKSRSAASVSVLIRSWSRPQPQPPKRSGWKPDPTRNTCLPLLPHRHNAPHAGWQQREKRPIKEKPLMVLRRAVLLLCDLSLACARTHTHTHTHTHSQGCKFSFARVWGSFTVNQTLNERDSPLLWGHGLCGQ